ncbi:MAG: acyltransferase [Lachnospiraceae bacterium]|nr:acyltransferase [Lachnospiraceae bacterium]
MKYIIIHILVFIVFPIAFFFKSNIRKQDQFAEILNKNDTYVLRGFAAIGIMIAHYVGYSMREASDFGGLCSIWQYAGGLGVCIFFFCSGYGLLLSTKNRDINKQFLWKRGKSILPTYWVLRLISALLLNKMKDGIVYFVFYVIGIKEQAWFVTEILLVYLLFYISIKIDKKKMILVMTLMLMTMSFLFFLLDFEARWYNANLLFALGMLFACYKEVIISWLNKKYLLKVIMVVFLFCMSAGIFVVLKKNGMPSDGMKLLASGLSCILLCQVLIKVKLESPCMIFIGKNSLQLYIIHLSVWSVFSQWYVPAEVDIQFKFCTCVAISFLCVCIYDAGRSLIKSIRKRVELSNICYTNRR